jgi:hypothetical protein
LQVRPGGSANGNGNGRRGYPARYSALGLLRRGLTSQDWPAAWHPQPMKNSYDVVIVGGGVHGLAAAYYLAAEHGITDVAVLDKSYLGSGDRSLKLYRRLATELDFNVMFSERGHLTLAHSDSSLRTMRWRAEVNKIEGVDSEVIGPEEVKRLAPFVDVSEQARYPILGALWHPPGGIIRHDAVVWGYARGAAARGVHIHQETEVTGINVTGGRTSRPAWCSTPPQAGARSSPIWPECGCLCRPIRSRPPSPSRFARSLTLSSCRERCTSTSARPTAASLSSVPALTRTRPTRCAARSSSSRASPLMSLS